MKNMKLNLEDLESTVQSYVLGTLSESHAQEFEAYFLSRPDVIEMIEHAQQIHLGLEAQFGGEEAKTAVVVQSKPLMQRLLGYLTVPVPAFAVILMAAFLSPLAINSFDSKPLGGDIEIVNFSTLTTRSAIRMPALDLSNVQGNAALMVKVKSVKHQYYKVKLTAAGSSVPLWTSEAFEVSSLRDHLVLLPEYVLLADLTVDVVGINADLSETSVEFCHYSEVC